MIAPRRNGRCGLSRLDVALAIILVGIVFSLLVIAIGSLQPRPRGLWDGQTINNVKQIALAIHSYNDVFRKLPPAFDKHGLKMAVSVHVHLLPYVEQDVLYKQITQSLWADAGNAIVPPYLSPSDPSSQDYNGGQNFAANLRVFSDKGLRTPWDRDMFALAAIEPGNASIPATFTDGTQNTVVFTTKYRGCGKGGSRFTAAPNSPFAAFFGENAARVMAHPSNPGVTFQLLPGTNECRPSPLTAQSFRETGIAIGLADGSVRRLSPTIRPRTWNLILQPNDNQSRGDEWE